MEADLRPLRADAARNRARVLDAAREAFAEMGLDVGVEEIARRAGVGEGTLYRLSETASLAPFAACLWSASRAGKPIRH